MCCKLSASRARGPCVVLSPALSDAHAAAAGAESRVNVPRVRLTCSRARTESRPIEACGGKRAARAGTHQLLLRPRRWRAERRPLSPCERRERRRRLRAASERFAASLQQHAAEPVCQCAAARRRRAPSAPPPTLRTPPPRPQTETPRAQRAKQILAPTHARGIVPRVRTSIHKFECCSPGDPEIPGVFGIYVISRTCR